MHDNELKDAECEKKQPGLIRKAGFISAGFVLPLIASTSAHAADEFDDFKTAITDLIQGSLGKGIALVALLLGGLIGLAKSSAWPALTGLAIAAVFGLGPFLIETIFSTFKAVGP